MKNAVPYLFSYTCVFFFSKVPFIFVNLAMRWVSLYQCSLKNLYLSCKMDLNFWACFGRRKKYFKTKMNMTDLNFGGHF